MYQLNHSVNTYTTQPLLRYHVSICNNYDISEQTSHSRETLHVTPAIMDESQHYTGCEM